MFRKFAVFMVFILLAGCSDTVDEIGIVARVNGEPIYLSQLEFQHDQFQVETVGGYVPSVEKLKAEYGEILTELIVQELVVQELVNQDIGVTDHELLKAEEEVRTDYPEGAFDQMLVEEYIDLKTWRLQLRNHLAMRKFFHQVLRPQIKIDYLEAERYYRDRISDFYLPESLRILVVRGPSREIVGKAVEKFRAERDQVDLATAFGEVQTREVVLREERLSTIWKNALTGLKAGQASGVLTDRFGFEILVLLERSPAKVLEPAQAYPLVEKALLEIKLQDAFDAWFSSTVARASILVSSQLLPSDEPEQAEPEPLTDTVEPDMLQGDGAEPDPAGIEFGEEVAPPLDTSGDAPDDAPDEASENGDAPEKGDKG
ncbi:MAG: peptidylprolyl isomerase [Pseudodesulfovibrio sp.]|uniref:peptidylprolyl isomerase n=1 Tax=Pseudodesulfovibrio aespoeensis (strain ATCC 700646 / DSM 10631 / Aspo-2) TaxID=643562 RepID=E6VYI2_PSEA9|nr:MULTISPECIES: peptidylprolyl isomerase [Pseudodesulfovibrio]MBU4193136.1 peptidylprolyl isomerase [Pseudomonadota bacterium]ADU62745.1 hypothetical protein Daes_1733 [Pseudodesulfovibrio aespoeensis Aspo-2]MBU4244714.1 peptidylprolyl isomerase [Pseudomonadota bacterium]MBU4379430.1 peptidylprolyl isomerase [Pseudomonadota bacterium]MBU4474204.1 peptidylprolyl isomerase [Pseudomonadota bacterium]